MKKREQEKDIGLGRKRKKRNIHKCVQQATEYTRIIVMHLVKRNKETERKELELTSMCVAVSVDMPLTNKT